MRATFPVEPFRIPRLATWAGWLLSGLLILYLYGVQGNAERITVHGTSAILWMTARWSGQYATDHSFGWLIPVVSAGLVWRRRAAIAAAATTPDRRGYGGVLLALLLYWGGVQGQQTRLTLLSLPLLLWSMALAQGGWAKARHLIFPAAYLLFCIPFSFLDSLTFPLRLLGAKVSVLLLNGLGVATQRVGTAIHSATPDGFHFDIADPCSGLRSILALTAIAALYAHLTLRHPVRQWLLFLASFPLAIAGNIIRIVSIGLASLLFGQRWATGFYHDYSSFIFFTSAILLLHGVGALLRFDWTPLWNTPAPSSHASRRRL